jgi:hypothetical protein
MNTKTHGNILIYRIALLIPVVLGIVGFVGAFIITEVSFFNDSKNTLTTGGKIGAGLMLGVIVAFYAVFLSSIIPLFTQTILSLVETHRMWNAINDGKARMTGGKAVGFLFIPFFSLYWIFEVWNGFPTDYNAYVNRYNLQNKVPALDNSLHIWIPILCLLSAFILPLPALMIVFYFVMRKNNQAIDLLKQAVSELQFPANVISSPAFQQPQMNIAR